MGLSSEIVRCARGDAKEKRRQDAGATDRDEGIVWVDEGAIVKAARERRTPNDSRGCARNGGKTRRPGGASPAPTKASRDWLDGGRNTAR
jgi:hypothetical protein